MRSEGKRLNLLYQNLLNHHNALNYILVPEYLHSVKGCDSSVVKCIDLETKN